METCFFVRGSVPCDGLDFREIEQAILRPDDVFIVRCSHVSGLEALLLISAIACFWRTTGVVKPLVRFVFLAYQRETRSSHHDILGVRNRM